MSSLAQAFIRTAEPEDFDALCEIQDSAVEIFRAYDLGFIADKYPRSDKFYRKLFADCDILIALDENDYAVGFSLLKKVDYQLYIKQLSVRKEYTQQGFGTALMHKSIDHAKKFGYAHIILTTYEDLPFNEPFYKKLGFRELIVDKNWPELFAIREKEKAEGLDVKPRIAMILDLE